MPWSLVVKAVEAVTDARWVLLYVKRWLAAPLQRPDGSLIVRDKGTPQGSAVSPILANLFMHYAFDAWLAREFPACPFERYADDAVVHCRSEREARRVLAALDERMEQVGLRLHPDKTKIVYCRDGGRTMAFQGPVSFDFLGFTFRARRVRNKRTGGVFSGFGPAISKSALARCSDEVRSWKLHRRTGWTEAELARWINPIVRGWMDYYGHFYRWELYPLLARINYYLVRWLRKKYRRLRRFRAALAAWKRAAAQRPGYFAQWRWVTAVWQ